MTTPNITQNAWRSLLRFEHLATHFVDHTHYIELYIPAWNGYTIAYWHKNTPDVLVASAYFGHTYALPAVAQAVTP